MGGFARKVDFICESADERFTSNIEDYAIKAENEYHATDQFIFTIGGRIKYFSELEFIGSGRGCIIYKPTEEQRLSLTIGNGYYLPSLSQLYGWGDVMPFKFNTSLREEKITSYELAYYGRLSRRIKSNAAIFYNDYRDLIGYDPSGNLINAVDAYQHGLELSADFFFTNWLTGFLNYTYQTINRADFANLELDPNSMINLGLRANFISRGNKEGKM